MNIPLNIDWQQILLHWMNFTILAGGLYFLLYKPVKRFMAKREAYYRDLDDQAAKKLQEAEQIKAEYQAKLDAAGEEIRQSRAKAQSALQVSTEEQLERAKTQAQQILSHARAEAEHDREEILRASQRELRKLAAEAAKKIAFQEGDPFDQFLDLAERGTGDEE
ncbi:MAG: ATP synthase F0 subunit B [Oscillibacter sp.]|nr:ATP synthase F0 subunit B [Oscillibacter sp.]